MRRRKNITWRREGIKIIREEMVKESLIDDPLKNTPNQNLTNVHNETRARAKLEQVR